MAQAKIQFKLGIIEFSGEGEETWVATQLDKLIQQAPALLKLAPSAVGQGTAPSNVNQQGEPGIVGSEVALGTFLKDKNIGGNQVNRFLATAIWLYARGNKMLTTRDVTKALRDNQQPRLTNSSDCLNKNVSKGFCEKQGNQFFITPKGFEGMM
jgi:hypothetical protein